MTSIRPLALVPFLAAAISCSSNGASQDGGFDAGAGSTFTVASAPYMLQPGEEKYICTTVNLPAGQDAQVTAITPTYGAGTHHIFFAQTLAPEQNGTFDCAVLFRTTWVPLYLGGVESGTLNMPSGAGIRLPAGQQLLLQLHLQNPTTQPIMAQSRMTMTLAPRGTTLTQAGVFGLDHRLVSIPPRSTNHRTAMACRPNRQMDVFALMGHMHKLGSRIEFVRGGMDSTDSLFQSDWRFSEQPTTPVRFTLSPSDQVSLRCFHNNPTDLTIPWGESSDNEMCAMVLYYTPFDALDGCVEDGTTSNSDGGTTNPGAWDGAVPASSCGQRGDTGNDQGVGRFCTPTGNECMVPSPFCLAALAPSEGQFFCTHLCTSDNQCGTGASCQGDSRGRVCFPNRCIAGSDAGR